MSGLLALLDDVAAIAKVAATSLDDVAAQAAQAGTKAAGVVIDDAAVTPKYVHGFDAKRELPIIAKIATGSLKNKLLILLPASLFLSAFAPWVITPILTLGGAYLCFEGAEKVFHRLFPHGDHEVELDFDVQDPAHLEEEKVAGAIKTDFVLSAEIMTIALAAIPSTSVWMQGAALAIVGAGITAAVYGAVALIVKMDDVGLFMARRGKFALTRAAGRGLVVAMPRLMSVLSTIGTGAMLWVGGSIVIHGAEVLGWGWLGHHIHDWASAVGNALPAGNAIGEWLVTALIDGGMGLVLGMALIPVTTRILLPLWRRVFG